MGDPASPVGAQLRIGVVGIGFGQAAHVPAFRGVERCVVQAIAASEISRARLVADRLAIPEAFGSWRELLSAEIDAVAIALPPDLQPDVVAAAAARGLHVFCEKPLAADLAGARRALAAVTAAGVVHAIDLEYPELPEWAEALSLVDAGALGLIEEVRIVWHTRTGLGRSPRSAWKASDARGGGAAGALLAHAVHHARRFLGSEMPELRSCRGRRSLDEVKEIELIAADARRRVTISVNVDHAGEPLHSVEAMGSRSTLTLASRSPAHAGPFSVAVDGRTLVSPPDTRGEDRRAQGVGRLARRFAAAIRSQGVVAPSLEDGVRVQEVIDAVAART